MIRDNIKIVSIFQMINPKSLTICYSLRNRNYNILAAIWSIITHPYRCLYNELVSTQ